VSVYGPLQIMRCVQLFDDEVMAVCDASARHCFAPLMWTLKVLTLDKPADVRRCSMPLECNKKVNTTVVRRLLACRIDFSRDAIAKINLDSVVSFATTSK
jgi:hypothetical protein